MNYVPNGPPLFPWQTLSFPFNTITGSLGLLGLKIAADMLVKACGGELGHGDTPAEEPVEQEYFLMGILSSYSGKSALVDGKFKFSHFYYKPCGLYCFPSSRDYCYIN